MQFKLLLVLVGFSLLFSCTAKKNTTNTNIYQNVSNIPVNSNVNSPTLVNNNANRAPETVQQPVNSDILKQIEEQQRESKRLAEERINSGNSNSQSVPSNSNQPNSTSTPKNTLPKSNVPPAQRRTT
ncbi:MAG: hypothetical protein K1X72_00845 [Pyrinomonadaceae bacterium]|nr:hypothetical protein [Pyrinomonadaceae bacterium]